MAKLLLLLAIMVVSTYGQGFVTFDQFSRAVTSNNYPPPSQQQYQNFNGLARSAGGIASLQEAAMALAQFLHESGGLKKLRETACIQNNCQGSYTRHGCEVPGKYYYGRGYIQLSWCYNYRDASAAIFGDPKVLLNDPDRVMKDDRLAWQTSFWFWRHRVRNRGGVLSGQFGASTMAINSRECKPGNHQKQARFVIYGKVRHAFGLPGAGDSSGC